MNAVRQERKSTPEKNCMRDVDRGRGDDAVREESQEQNQDKEEEFVEGKTTRKHDLCQLNEQERIEHEMTHLPFRSWCRHCITGRGREEDCRRETSSRNPF